MNWTHLFIGLVVASWVLSVEYRLWANLKILSEQLKVGQKRERDHLRAVEK
jgi:hypothetical protein